MADKANRSQQEWSLRSVLLWLAALAVVTPLLFWAYVWAWFSVPDPSPQELTTYLTRVVARDGVPARLQSGRMVKLRHGDITEVAESRCVREYDCRTSGGRRRRSTCWDVAVTFTCTYDVTDRSGAPATAILIVSRNDFYDPHSQFAHAREPYLPGGMELNEADDKLCRPARRCSGSGDRDEQRNRQDAATQPSESTPLASHVAKIEPGRAPRSVELAFCAGVVVESIGGRIMCLDPSTPDRREFQDCTVTFCGPVMTVLPKGDYLQTHEHEPRDERRRRRVRIGYQLTVGKFEATFAEWDACVADGGCRHRPDDNGWGRGPRPVINVSWEQITKEYLPWLNRKLGLSGKNAYRLLTADEWEYAARGVTSSVVPRTPFEMITTPSSPAPHIRYAWGDEIGVSRANCDGCGSAWDARQTAPVGSFAPNAFGLHDMHGNAEEWTDECRRGRYSAAAGVPKDLRECTARGGSYSSKPDAISFHQGKAWTVASSDGSERGFRLARTLTSP
jgi:formylglycine-generating enzyme required for sulfatase activity